MFIKKFSFGLMTAMLVTTLLAGPVAAKTVKVNKVLVSQKAKTTANTAVNSVPSTGGNMVLGTTAKCKTADVSVTTGSATSKVDVAVIGGDNTAVVDPCGCEPTVLVCDKCKTNSTWSMNVMVVEQTSGTVANTLINSTVSTGNNMVVNTTGGDVTVDTGNASSTIGVEVSGGSNSINPAI